MCEPLGDGARCEEEGVCSVADQTCPSGHRFAASAGGLAGTCVGEPQGDGSPPPGVDDAGSNGREMAAIGAGLKSFCAVSAEGNVWCWGAALNAPGLELQDEPAPILVRNGSGQPLGEAVDIDVGEYHACARLADGTIACWGSNYNGQLGTGGSERAYARVIPDLSGATRVLADSAIGCALKANETLWCWGNNSNGSFGVGNLNSPLGPTQFGGSLSGVTEGSVSNSSICAVVAGGQVRCAGNNGNGQLGNGEAVEASKVSTPVTVVVDESSTPLAGVTVMDGGNNHNCALAAGAIRCWGDDQAGELGEPTPRVVLLANTIDLGGVACEPVAIRTRNTHSCARCDSGRVVCWGNGEDGRLGNGALEDSSSPVFVNGIDDATDLAVGQNSSCALQRGEVWCWGDDGDGQLGDGIPFGGDAFAAEPVRLNFP